MQRQPAGKITTSIPRDWVTSSLLVGHYCTVELVWQSDGKYATKRNENDTKTKRKRNENDVPCCDWSTVFVSFSFLFRFVLSHTFRHFVIHHSVWQSASKCYEQKQKQKAWTNHRLGFESERFGTVWSELVIGPCFLLCFCSCSVTLWSTLSYLRRYRYDILDFKRAFSQESEAFRILSHVSNRITFREWGNRKSLDNYVRVLVDRQLFRLPFTFWSDSLRSRRILTSLDSLENATPYWNPEYHMTNSRKL